MHLLPLLRSKTISGSLIFSTSGHTVCLDDPSITQCAQNGNICKKLIAADPVVHKSRQIPQILPTPWGISGNLPVLQMLQQGPRIARRADRVGVLPLAPLASFAGKNYLQKLSFSTSRRTVCLDDPSTTQCAQNGKMWKKLIAADPVVQKSRQIP